LVGFQVFALIAGIHWFVLAKGIWALQPRLFGQNPAFTLTDFRSTNRSTL
jgi:hypothetical protein